MNIESGISQGEDREWQAPTNELKKDESEFGAMAGLAKFFQKMPGGKYLLPSVAMLSMLGDGIKEASADAKDYLRYKEGVRMMTPVVLANEFRAGVSRKADGSYIVDSKEKLPQANDLLGDLVYRSGREIILPQDTEKTIQDDLAAFKKELRQVCKDQKLTASLENGIQNFATETFPNGFDQDGFITVQRPNESGEGQTTKVKAQWATFNEAQVAISGPMATAREQIYGSLKDNNARAKVTNATLSEYCDLIEDAALFNLARAQAAEEDGQK